MVIPVELDSAIVVSLLVLMIHPRCLYRISRKKCILWYKENPRFVPEGMGIFEIPTLSGIFGRGIFITTCF